MIYLTSDTHFCHDKDFIYSPRGYSSVQEMNQDQIKNWNETVSADDDIYMLGDFFLGTDTDFIKKTVSELNGKIHLIVGNHDTPAKLKLYAECKNIVEIVYAAQIKHRQRYFYLSHYPTLTADLQTRPEKAIVNIFGHTHSKEKFYNDSPYMYNVALDANDNKPVSIDDIYNQVISRVQEIYG